LTDLVFRPAGEDTGGHPATETLEAVVPCPSPAAVLAREPGRLEARYAEAPLLSGTDAARAVR
jgi:hypothetical protein